jgi:peptide/nickel transport system substrate-binding protein
VVPEESSRVASLEAGETDYINVGVDSVLEVEDEFQIFERGGPSVLELYFQLGRESNSPTEDINFRQALSQSIDRDAINEGLVGSLGEVSANIFGGGQGSVPLEADPYDPDQAEELLAESGYDGEVLQFQSVIRAGWPQMLTIAETVQDYWSRIGIESEITNRDFAAFDAEWTTGSLPPPAVVIMDMAPRPDWIPWMRGIGGCEGVRSIVCDEELDQMVDEWAATTTPSDYEQSAREVEAYVRDNYYVLGILLYAERFAGSSAIPSDFTQGLMVRAINTRGLIWER